LSVRPPNNRPINRIEQFQGQIDLPIIQQTIRHLRQELESQKLSIAQTRRGLPRGWYRQSNPTVDLEILTNVLPVSKSVQLPNIWPSSLASGNNR
jgi:hypothetical protein